MDTAKIAEEQGFESIEEFISSNIECLPEGKQKIFKSLLEITKQIKK